MARDGEEGGTCGVSRGGARSRGDGWWMVGGGRGEVEGRWEERGEECGEGSENRGGSERWGGGGGEDGLERGERGVEGNK